MVIMLRCYRIIHANGVPKCMNCVIIDEFKFPNDHDFGIDYDKSPDNVREQWRQYLSNWKLKSGKSLPTKTLPTAIQQSFPVHYNVFMFGLPKGMSRIHNPQRKGAYMSLFPGYDDNGNRLSVAEHGYITKPKKV